MKINTRILALALALPALLAPASVAHAQTLADLYPSLGLITPSDAGTGEQAGLSIAVSGNTLAIGAPFDVVTNPGQGSVRIYVRSGTTWALQQTITASDGAANDNFGYSVSLSGDTVAVGVPSDDVGANADQGSVRVFTRIGTTWIAQQTLTASDGAAGDLFGRAVSLSLETLVATVPNDDVGANANQGSVRVFQRSGSNWFSTQTLTASDGAANDSFGWTVALSGDTLAAGVAFDDVGVNVNQGSVRVFVRSGTTWSAQQTLTASDGAANDSLGLSVALSGDTLATGASEDDVGAVTNQGSVRVFTRSGTTWSAQQTVTAPDGAVGDYFGDAVSLFEDTLAVGVPFDDVGANPDQGSVRVFARSGSTWVGQATLTAQDGSGLEYMGFPLVATSDAIFAGMPTDDVGAIQDQGSVRIFGNSRVWNQTRGIGSATLASAVGSALAGDRLLVGNIAFSQADDVIDASQKALTFVGLEPLTLSANAMLTVANNTVFQKSPDVAAAGLTVAGKLTAPVAGSVSFSQLTVASGGQFAQRNSSILVNQNLATASGGICYLQGPILAEAVTTAVGGQNRVAADTDVFASYNNAGSTVIQRGILYIYGTLTNTGTITGNFNNGFLPPNPGDGYSIGGDYVVSAESSIILDDPVWWLRVGGNFDVAINSASRFVMDQATLELTGTGPGSLQSVEVLSRDRGAVDAGFATTNFPLGALRLRSGANASLENNHLNAPGKGTEAIYTQQLVVPAGATLTTNGYKIYTRVATIAGTVSNPSDIVVVPAAPPCVADIVTDGVVNAADLALLLTNWGPCSGSCVADLDADGQVGAADLATLLASWGPCVN